MNEMNVFCVVVSFKVLFFFETITTSCMISMMKNKIEMLNAFIICLQIFGLMEKTEKQKIQKKRIPKKRMISKQKKK